MERATQNIVLDLHGSKAQRGVDLDGLQLFLEHFRRALREFERVTSGRSPVPRTGRPDSAAGLASAFRVVSLKPGSGILTLEAAVPVGSAESLPLGDVETVAVGNLIRLAEAVTDRDSVDGAVVDALDRARRSLGDDGSFGLCAGGRSRVAVDAAAVQALRAAAVDPADRPLSVSGRVHLIEVEEPSKVAIRATDGTDWLCVYSPELEPVVLGLVKQLVWARGSGSQTSTGRGRMRLTHIEPVPVHLQPRLFVAEPRDARELAEEQGISAPQTIEETADPGWVDDAASKRFLEFVLGDEG